MSFPSMDYDDLVVRHRQSSDILWALKQWNNPTFDNKEQSIKSKKLIQKNTQVTSVITPVHYKALPRNSEQIKTDVLHSLPLKYTVESANSDQITYEKAKLILEEMSHRLNMTTVRFLGFVFAKIFNQVYEHIYVDRRGIDLIYQLYSLDPVVSSPPPTNTSPMSISSTLFAILNTFSRSPNNNGETINPTVKSLPSPLTTNNYFSAPRIVYLPTHRSYMDFILLTYLCYDYNIPLPCIAAAQDFLGLGILANMLRNCGAFFIRRSFRSDLLYWTIFDEYVKTHLVHGDYPLEFFIEGARSRTLKTLLPARQGMLKSCLECYFRRQTENLILIPIAINYEKVLEDNLHANELLGIPKPKESKSGLLKATQILKKSFGTMIVRFSEPIDVHDAFESFRIREEENILERRDAFNRIIPRGIEARFICQQNGLTDIEEKFLDDLSYRVVNQQQSLSVIFPITVVAFSLLQSHIMPMQHRTSSIQNLINDKQILVEKHSKVLEHFSEAYQVHWPSNNDERALCQRLVSLYSDMFDLSNDHSLKLKVSGDRSTDAGILMKLIIYRNTCLHLFSKPAFILLGCYTNSQGSIPYEQLKMYYQFLIRLFTYEFVYDRSPSTNNHDTCFDQYLAYWIKENYLIATNDLAYRINEDFRKNITLIVSPFEQYARAYLTIYEQKDIPEEKNLTSLVKAYQKSLLSQIDLQNIVSVIASSSNVITNALRTSNFGKKSLILHELRHLLKRILEPSSAYLQAKL